VNLYKNHLSLSRHITNFQDPSLLTKLEDTILNDIAQDALPVVKCRDA